MAFVGGSYGLTNLYKSAYAQEFPSTVKFAEAGSTQGYSGSVGFGYTLFKAMLFKVGVEALYPAQVKSSTGANSSGTPYVSLSNETFAIVPQANLEFFLKSTSTTRFYFGLGAGYAYANLKNTVSVTTAGTTALGISDYIEEGAGNALMYAGYAGFEFGLVDNIDLATELGYRSLLVKSYTSSRDTRAPHEQVSKGSVLKNADGTNRTTDLGGAWVGLTLRFWIK